MSLEMLKSIALLNFELDCCIFKNRHIYKYQFIIKYNICLIEFSINYLKYTSIIPT